MESLRDRAEIDSRHSRVKRERVFFSHLQRIENAKTPASVALSANSWLSTQTPQRANIAA